MSIHENLRQCAECDEWGCKLHQANNRRAIVVHHQIDTALDMTHKAHLQATIERKNEVIEALKQRIAELECSIKDIPIEVREYVPNDEVWVISADGKQGGKIKNIGDYFEDESEGE